VFVDVFFCIAQGGPEKNTIADNRFFSYRLNTFLLTHS